MKICCTSMLCLLICLSGAAKTFTLSATRGDITISNFSSTPALLPGDTLFIPATGKYTSVQYRRLNGDSLNAIHIIWLPGSKVTSPGKGFQQLSDFSVSFVVIENMLHYDFFGTHRFSYHVHDLVFKNCQWINPEGSYKDQPAMIWDDAYAPVSMVFKGKKMQTFYNISYTGCRLEGFMDANMIQVSSLWNSENNEISRSIALDFSFAADTFQHITNRYGQPVAAIGGTGFGCSVNHCVFRNIAGPGTKQLSHSTAIMWYGSIDVCNCIQENCGAQLLRCVPRGWTGLPGYLNKTTACRCWRNIVHNNLTLSVFEFNQDIGGNRNAVNGMPVIKAYCLYNTIYRTRRVSYRGDWFGFAANNVNQDSLDCSYNLLISPECDYPFDPNRGYIVAVMAKAPHHQKTTANKVFKSWNTSIIKDSIDYRPGSAASIARTPERNYPFITTDFNDAALPEGGPLYAGAIEGTIAAADKKRKSQ